MRCHLSMRRVWRCSAGSSSPRDEGGMQLAWRKNSSWVRRATATTSAPGRLKTNSVGSLAQKKNGKNKERKLKSKEGRN